MLDFTPEETAKFTPTERRIILMVRVHNITDHITIRELLSWPDDPFNITTYRSVWSRLKKKMAFITTRRQEEKELASKHAGTTEVRADRAIGFMEGMAKSQGKRIGKTK